MKTRLPAKEDECKHERKSKKKGRAPADTDERERKGYYAYLSNKYDDRKDTRDDDDRRVVWTDGSAIEDEAGKMRAGAGVFYGVGNEKNRALEVQGVQSNQRAELTAVLRCLEFEEERVHIKTDSMYVQLGVTIWMSKWKSKAWYKRVQKLEEIDHADLWQKLDNIISQREPGAVKISWVKGHALPRHINCGMTTEEDIWGNNEADIQAGRASATAARAA